MKHFLLALAHSLGRSHHVEFDYRDNLGVQHGCCDVRLLFGGEKQVERLLKAWGYTHIKMDG